LSETDLKRDRSTHAGGENVVLVRDAVVIIVVVVFLIGVVALGSTSGHVGPCGYLEVSGNRGPLEWHSVLSLL
jgi:hypothetical protein